MQTLSMLWTISQTPTDNTTDDHRYTFLPAKHIGPLGGMIENLIKRQWKKVNSVMYENWSYTKCCRSKGEPRQHLLC